MGGCLPWCDRVMSLSAGLSRSIAAMAASTVRPIVDCLAWAFRFAQRASGGTQKMFSAVYSSRSSAASSPHVASTAARRSSKASEMYFKKICPSTTCLYSAASIEPRRAAAIAHSFAS